MHPALGFTIEREVDGQIAFLDMKISNLQGMLSSTWYNKPTDKGLIMNYHALAPKCYKRSGLSGFFHRIHRSCSNWSNFHTSLEKAKQILENNQCPQVFYNLIIEETITGLMETRPGSKSKEINGNDYPREPIKKKLVFVQYRGKVTKDFAWALQRIKTLLPWS